MNQRPMPRSRRSGVVVLVLIVAAVLGGLAYQVSSSATPPADADPATRGELTEADGILPEGATIGDEQYPGVANLDEGLREALRDAASDAAESGVEIYITSGWRSVRYQKQLLDDAVAEYGSRAEAARWVATPQTSVHVSGEAVDIGPMTATDWLAQRGDDYGLCQIYDNESWHYELRPEAVERGCPRTYPDPTFDPRLS